jgi:hypothetical protein
MKRKGTSDFVARAIKKAAYVGSGATLGFITGNVPGAALGGYLGSKQYDKTYPQMPQMDVDQIARQATLVAQGHRGAIAGRFSRPRRYARNRGYSKGKFLVKRKRNRKAVKKRTRRRRAVKKTRITVRKRRAKILTETAALNSGYHVTREYYGRVEDPHCCYISHSTVNVNEMAIVIGAAVIRRLLKKAGIETSSLNQELPLFNKTDSSGFRIVYTAFTPVTGVQDTPVNYDIPDDTSLQGLIVGVSAVPGHIINSINNFLKNNNSAKEPHSIALYSADNNVAAVNYRLAASINLVSENIHIGSHSVLKVQNRTAADIADATNTNRYALDRVDQQPLKGYLYSFKHGEPRLKFPQTHPNNEIGAFNRIAETGYSIIRAAQIATNLQEPPVPSFWANTLTAAKITMNPGTIKHTSITHQYRGKLTNILKKIRTTAESGTLITGATGKCQMIALEEWLRTAGTNPITLQYERELKLGCIAYSSRTKNTLLSDLSTTEFNNLP